MPVLLTEWLRLPYCPSAVGQTLGTDVCKTSLDSDPAPPTQEQDYQVSLSAMIVFEHDFWYAGTNPEKEERMN
jgi:hypothetical protein